MSAMQPRLALAALALASALACSPPPTETAPPPPGTIAPWPVPSNEGELIRAAGQDDLTTGTRQTITWQIHLDVYQDGVPVQVPANIGIDWDRGFTAPVHTHLPAGEIDVESPVLRDFTLGQFFVMWGVSLAGATAYVNGVQVPDPAAVVFAQHQEIVVAFGRAPGTIPSAFPTVPPKGP